MPIFVCRPSPDPFPPPHPPHPCPPAHFRGSLSLWFSFSAVEQACKGEEARRSTSEYISARQRQLYTEAVEAKAAEARAEMLYLRNAQRRSAGAAAAAAAADSKTPTSDDSEVGGDLYPRRSTFSKRSDVLLFPVPGGLSEVGKILAKAERRLLRAWEGATTARPNVWHLSTHVADAYRAAGLEVHPTQLDQVVKWVAATIRSPHATPASFAARGEVPRAPLFALTAGTGEAPKVMYIGGWSLTD